MTHLSLFVNALQMKPFIPFVLFLLVKGHIQQEPQFIAARAEVGNILAGMSHRAQS